VIFLLDFGTVLTVYGIYDFHFIFNEDV
jgi:hypothetical protein